MSTYANTGLADVDTLLAQNSHVIDKAIYESHLYMSPWYTVFPKSALPVGVGNAMTSLIYDKSIPTVSAGGAVGVNWQRVGVGSLGANSLNTSTDGQVIAGAATDTIGSTSDGTSSGADAMAFVNWTKKLRSYYLEIARIKSPYVDVNDLRQAANLSKQTTAITNALGDATRWVWERRNQLELERLAANFVPCLTASTPILTTVDADTDSTADDSFYGVNLTDLDLATSGSGNTNVVPTADISNKIMDRLYTRLKIVSPLSDAYAIDNGAPVFACMLSSEASYQLKTESGIRDDVRESSKVDDLIKPLGINSSFRGFAHIVDDCMPRFTESSGALTRVEPLTATGAYNASYDTAEYEAMYIFTKSVLEVQIPPPNVSAPGFQFNPVNYSGEFQWLNIRDEIKNPLGTIGFFLGTVSSASLPKHVERAYVLLRKRNTTPGA